MRATTPAIITLVLAMVLSACGAVQPNLDTSAPETQSNTASLATNEADGVAPAIGPEIYTQPDPDTLGRWKRTDVSFESDDTGERVLPEIRQIERIGSTYWAYGKDGGSGGIWTSADLTAFTKVLDTRDLDCCRLTRFTDIVEFNGLIVAGGTVRQADPDDPREDIEHSMLVYSADAGATWAEVDDPVVTTLFHRLDRLEVANGTLVAEIYEDECCAGLIDRRVRTTDLETWIPVTLPDAESVGVIATDDSFITVSYPDFGVGTGRAWESADASTWTEVDPPAPNTPRLVHVGDTVLQVPRRTSRDSDVNVFDPLRQSVLVDGSWVDIPIDIGQFGDTPPSFGPTVSDPATNRTYAILGRATRANDHYCFDDLTTCRQFGRTVVVTTDGGFTWSDLPGAIHDEWARGELLVDLRGNPVYWFQQTGSEISPVTVTQWIGSRRPVRVDPPAYPPPTIPLPLISWDDELAVGGQSRFIWSFGACKRDDTITVDSVQWQTVDPTDPSVWPHRTIDVSDGPANLAYGVLERTAIDRLEFSLPELGVVATLRPLPPAEPDPNAEGC